MTTLIELLCIETGAPAETIGRIARTGPLRYKVYNIPKRNGGHRTIAHPARELKLLQRIILRSILDKITPSRIATAYVKNRGILFNASQHVNARWILKLDFLDFFHSITPADWDRIVRRTPLLQNYAKDQQLLHHLLFWGGGPRQTVPSFLSIGAPTSPSISNLACNAMDQWMIGRAEKLGITVTRYADDITLSGSSVSPLLKFEASLTSALSKNLGLKLALNDAKRGLYGPGQRRMVTGLILAPDGKISIGRERKREISSLVHRFMMGDQELIDTIRTKGLVAFAMSAEPAFVSSITEKYGLNTINRLMKADPNSPVDIAPFDF